MAHKLPQDVNTLAQTEEIDTVLRPVSAQSVLRRDSFNNGEIHFRFASTASDKYFYPTKSFFQLHVRLTRADGTPLMKSDGIALAQNCCGSLFQNCTVNLGGQQITKCSRYLTQVDTLRQRMQKTKPWIDTVGDKLNGWGDWQSRLERVCLDGADNLREDGPAVPLTSIVLTDPTTRATTAWPEGDCAWGMEIVERSETGYGFPSQIGFFSRRRVRLRIRPAAGDALPDLRRTIRRFDRITHEGGSFLVDRVDGPDSEFDLDGVNDPQFAGPNPELNGTDWYIWAIETDPSVIGQARNAASLFPAPITLNQDGSGSQITWQSMTVNPGVSDMELLWSPPSALFHDHHKMLPQAAELEIILQPHSDFTRAAVECRPTTIGGRSRAAGPVPSQTFLSTDGDYKFSVEAMTLYICETRGHPFKQRKFLLNLHEIDAQMAIVPGADRTENPFNVNNATSGLTVAFADRRHLNDSRCGRTVFKAYGSTADLQSGARDQLHENLRAITVDYAGQMYPQNQPEFSLGIEYDPTAVPVILGRDYFTQRYFENLLYSDREGDIVGVETFREWRDRGYYIHWQCDKAAGNNASRVIVRHQFAEGTDTSQMNLVLFAHYKFVVEITLNDIGRVDSVRNWSLM